ncbi:MAG TPA: MraY family glycosyltransferase [candidate division Zixibacteria bacterium]|nr:MraY family glycosyltransferase [candidate division Zixibacteria bacterium]
MSKTEIMALVLSLLLSLALLPMVIKLSKHFGWLDRPGRHKQHAQPTPYLGGAVLFVSTWLTIAVLYLFDHSLFDDLTGLAVVFGGAAVIFVLGLIDDIHPLSAWVKLLVQIGIGLLLFWGGVGIDLLSTPGGSIELGSWSAVLTIVWVVGLTNAVNLIDGLDGLAGGVSLIAAVTMAVIARFFAAGWELLLIVALLGFLVPFLFFNRYPARIFLGDSGSMQIGYYFAVFSLMLRVKSFTLSALFVPLLTLGVPLTEAISSTIRRLVTGKSVMQADRRHLFHYLGLLGLGPRRTVAVFYGLGVVFGLFAVAMYLWDRVLVLSLLVVFMVVIFAVFFILVTGLSRRFRSDPAELRKRVGKNRR